MSSRRNGRTVTFVAPRWRTSGRGRSSIYGVITGEEGTGVDAAELDGIISFLRAAERLKDSKGRPIGLVGISSAVTAPLRTAVVS